MTKQQRWFQDGSESFRRVMNQYGSTSALVDVNDLYRCPLCLAAFSMSAIQDGQLSIEHVPPESLGGRPLLLTCKECNNRAGTAFDADAGRVERLRSLYAGTSEDPIRATYTLNGATVTGELYIVGAGRTDLPTDYGFSIESETGGGIHFKPVPRINHPTNVRQFDEALADPTASISASFKTHARTSQDMANISWIRSAYLAAFAVFGWRYILRSNFDLLRGQLQLGKDARLPSLYRFDAEADPQKWGILVVHEHEDCPCLLVAMGQHFVFLPPLGDQTPLDEVAANLLVAEEHGGLFTGIMESWPLSPRYVLDNLMEEQAALSRDLNS